MHSNFKARVEELFGWAGELLGFAGALCLMGIMLIYACLGVLEIGQLFSRVAAPLIAEQNADPELADNEQRQR